MNLFSEGVFHLVVNMEFSQTEVSYSIVCNGKNYNVCN